MIPSGWVIISYSLLKKHHDGLREREWDLLIIEAEKPGIRSGQLVG
jgi:hypothetical protein